MDEILAAKRFPESRKEKVSVGERDHRLPVNFLQFEFFRRAALRPCREAPAKMMESLVPNGRTPARVPFSN